METVVKNSYEYHVFNAKGVHDYKEEADPLNPSIFAVFLRDSALTIEEKIKAKGMNGGYYNKRVATRVYKVQTNKHGERYLRVLRKTGSGVMLSVSTNELARGDHCLYAYKGNARANEVAETRFRSAYKDGQSEYCAEMVQLIEKHLSKILGFKFTHGPVPKVDDPESGRYSPDYLYYPFYREPSNKDFVEKFLIANKQPASQFYEQREVSKLASTGSRGLQAALRGSKTQEDFVKNMVYKSYVKTTEDVQQVIDSPQLLSFLSRIDLRLGVKEAVSNGFVHVFDNYTDYMTASEYISFKIMLPNLPKENVSDVLKLALRIAKFRTEKEAKIHLKSDLSQLDRFSYGSSCAGNAAQLVKAFQQVPPKDRRKFAIVFWEEFRKDYLQSEENFVPHSEQTQKNRKGTGGRETDENFIKVNDVFMKAYAQTRLASIPKDAKESCVKTAMDFFGQDISQFEELSFQKVEIPALNVSMEYVNFHNLGYTQNKNLLTFLTRNEGTKTFFNDALIYTPIRHILKDHLLDSSDGILVSDLEQILRKAILKIDAALVKLGQPLTPYNRMIYLQSTERDRKFKINWKYYSLGVSPDEVSTYRIAGIRTKKDIRFWVETKNSVPEEMYEELLHDMAFGSTKTETDSILSDF